MTSSIVADGKSNDARIPFPIRNDIPFPFTPYNQQRQLMSAIYDCIENSACGVFESPTGSFQISIYVYIHINMCTSCQKERGSRFL